MGWFGSLFGQSSDQADPLRKLDPKLREFLERESPVKYKPGQQQQDGQQQQRDGEVTSAAAAAAAARSQRPAATPAPARAEKGDEKTVPGESLYQDGRYAHLWRTYRPLAEVEAETKSDHEKLMDVLEAYKERKAQIGRAALETCALEQLAWSDCMKSGDWHGRLTMCRAEVKKFERCYMMQSRLLKSLGYLSTYDRPPEVDEQIQMHADALYQRMLEQEAAIDKARAEGRPAPAFAPLLGGDTHAITKAMTTGATTTPKQDDDAVVVDFASMSAEKQKAWRDRLEKVPEPDRAAEEEAMKAEARAKAEIARKVKFLWAEKAEERRVRREQGRETLTDRVSGLFSGSGKS